MAKGLSIIGLVASLFGVLLLFRYGMPFRVHTAEGGYVTAKQADPAELRLDVRYKVIGYIGLALIVVGTGLQIAGVVWAKQ